MKNQLIKGTLILTLAGLITKILGFFYKIYLSNILGTKNLGIYQLIFPIYSICYTIYAAGIQTAISTLTASSKKNKKYPLLAGICLSLLLSTILSSFIYNYADTISAVFLKEKSCMNSLKMLSFVFPFCGVTACINGYFYGLKKTSVPAFTQLIEQVFRLLTFYIVGVFYSSEVLSCETAVLALIVGEFFSCIFNTISIINSGNINDSYSPKNKISYFYNSNIFSDITKLTVPLTSNKLFISILSSVESILIPAMLRRYGMSHSDSLSLYGILTGMSFSIIFFPSTIANSLSVVLLPTVSEADAEGDKSKISNTVSSVIHYCILIGILSVGIFSLFGKDIGIAIFSNQTSGSFISILAWICPFMYINTTLSSVLNGLSKPHITFFNSSIGLFIRIIFLVWLVPLNGIYGYLTGLLVSSILISLLDFITVNKSIKINFDACKTILLPSLYILPICLFFHTLYKYFLFTLNLNTIILLFIICSLISIIYASFLRITKII